MTARLALLAVLFAGLVLAAAAFAQEHQPAAQPGHEASDSSQAAGEHEGDAHAEFKYSPSVRKIAEWTGMSVESAYWVSVILNFVAVVVVLWVVLRPVIGKAFADRNVAIRQSIDEARKASEEAQKRLADIEARLARISTEIADLRSAAEADVAAEEARLRAAAEEDKAAILRAAEEEISAAARLARKDLKAYAAELAVSLAEKRIQVSEQADQQMVRSFLEQLSRDGR
ncbi:MAG TPA: ATP synthase F0 subunit B [Terriglobales bacterium]|nr:ATP synthase F0 subunit B [Terriglobales bacterium]